MTESVTLDASGLHWAASSWIDESPLQHVKGVVAVTAYAANHTASITYEPTETPVAQPPQWVRDYESHCAGRVVPGPACDSTAGASPELADSHPHADREEATSRWAISTRDDGRSPGRGGDGHAIIVGAKPLAARGPLFDSATAMETSVSSITTMSTHTGALTERQPTGTDFVVGVGGNKLVGRVSAIESASEHAAAAAIADYAAAIGQKRFRLNDFRGHSRRRGSCAEYLPRSDASWPRAATCVSFVFVPKAPCSRMRWACPLWTSCGGRAARSVG